MKTIYLPIVILLSFVVFSCSDNDARTDDTVVVTDDEGNMEEVNTSGNLLNVGDSASDLLSESTFDSIVVEIISVEGFEPNAATIDNFRTFLEDRIFKSGGIIIEQSTIVAPQEGNYTVSQIRDIEQDIRSQYNDSDTIAVFGMFLNNAFAGNTENGTVLGIAYQNTSFVVFEESVQSFSNQPLAPSRTVLETTVLNHEFGHLLGLVNNGTPLQSDHHDAANGAHCDVDNCLMFFQAETGEGILNAIVGGEIPELDAQCIADLQANGGR